MNSLLDSLRKDLDRANAIEALAHEEYKTSRRAFRHATKVKKDMLNAVQILEKEMGLV